MLADFVTGQIRISNGNRYPYVDICLHWIVECSSLAALISHLFLQEKNFLLVGIAKQNGHWIMLLDLIISKQMDSGCHEGSNPRMIYKALEVIWIFLVGT